VFDETDVDKKRTLKMTKALDEQQKSDFCIPLKPVLLFVT